eukprot:9214268-Pyramimonas_sp.AAC.1
MPQATHRLVRLAEPDFASIACRLPSRCPGSSHTLPRVRMESVRPAAASSLARKVLTQQRRRALNSKDTIAGGSELHADPLALIGDMNSPVAAN